jgi:hypothetical protein
VLIDDTEYTEFERNRLKSRAGTDWLVALVAGGDWRYANEEGPGSPLVDGYTISTYSIPLRDQRTSELARFWTCASGDLRFDECRTSWAEAIRAKRRCCMVDMRSLLSSLACQA